MGGRELVEKLSPYLKLKATIKAIRLIDRKILRLERAGLFSDAILDRKALRNCPMRAAHFEHGCWQKEIADHLGLHCTAVSNILIKKALK